MSHVRIAAWIVVFVALRPTLAQDSAPSSAPALTRASMEADLGALEAAVREKWSYLEDKQANFGVDLAALTKRAKAALPEVGSPAAFQAVVKELVAGLKDGHGSVFTPGVPDPSRRWPVTIADFADGVFVVKADPSLGHTIGCRVIAVGGVPIEKAIADAERSTIASTPAARRRLAIERMVFTAARSMALDLACASGAMTVPSTVTASTLGSETPSLRTDDRGPAWALDRPRPDIARLQVRSFAVARWQEWLSARPESRDAFLAETRDLVDRLFRDITGSKALILDLRGNGGGTDLLGIHLARHLLAKRFVYFHLSARFDGTWRKPHGYEHDPLPAEQRFDGPLAVLIDEECFSTTDNFLRALVENRDVIVVGRPTNGGTGAPAPVATLPNSRTIVTLCTQRVGGPKGTLTEGRGTQPTIPVAWRSADYFAGRDPDLAAALAALERASTR